MVDREVGEGRRGRPAALRVVMFGWVMGLACVGVAGGVQDEEHRQLFGAWKGASGALIAFEPGRVIQFREERLNFERARYRDDQVDMRNWGQVHSLWFEFLDGGLEICWTEFGDPEAFVRLSELPAELQVEALRLGKENPGPEQIKELQAEFAERVEQDQAVRQPPLNADRISEMQKVDRENTARLRVLVGRYGWIDARRFGAEASHAAFLFVQHSGDRALQLAALPRIEADVGSGLVGGQDYALLYDRLQLSLGYLQSYGSQLSTNADGETVLMACVEPQRLDERRKALGMSPIETYLDFFREPGDGPVRRLGVNDWD